MAAIAAPVATIVTPVTTIVAMVAAVIAMVVALVVAMIPVIAAVMAIPAIVVLGTRAGADPERCNREAGSEKHCPDLHGISPCPLAGR
ncbi:hypothetical protein GCM10009087_17530 [Sphingomonas oligophenolica]